MTATPLHDLLRSVPLFAGFDESVIGECAAALRIEHVEPGVCVVREGDLESQMFVVLEGELEVSKAGRADAEVRVALLGPGSFFGEMSLLEAQPRSATVKALAPCALVRLTPGDVEHLLVRRDHHAYTTFVTNLARELGRRLRVADGILAALMTSEPGGERKS